MKMLVLLCSLLMGCAESGYQSAYIISDVADEKPVEEKTVPTWK